jgi:hypothetical protein
MTFDTSKHIPPASVLFAVASMLVLVAFVVWSLAYIAVRLLP